MASASAGPAILVRDVSRRFGDRDVLRRLNLSIGANEFVALLGRSGTGKTTFLRILGGLDPEYEGEVLVPGRRAVVFQEPRLIPWLRVLPNVGLGLRPGGSSPGSGSPKHRSSWRGELRRQSLEALAEVGLASQARAWPVTLSGGEAQRAALARALVRDPQLMLLDEPVRCPGRADPHPHARPAADLCARHRPAVLLVTHDVDEAILLADRALVLADGQIRLDTRVTLPRPRDRGDHGFTTLRFPACSPNSAPRNQPRERRREYGPGGKS